MTTSSNEPKPFQALAQIVLFSLYKYRLLMRVMVENYCPEVKFNLSLLFTEARRAEVNTRLFETIIY